MKRTIKQTLVALSAIGVFGCATTAAQQPSKHVLQDAATGHVQPAKITLQPTPGAAAITKTMPFFSAGTLEGAEAALRPGIDHGEEAFVGNVNALTGGGQVQDTIGCSNRTSMGNVRGNPVCAFPPRAERRNAFYTPTPTNLLA